MLRCALFNCGYKCVCQSLNVIFFMCALVYMNSSLCVCVCVFFYCHIRPIALVIIMNTECFCFIVFFICFCLFIILFNFPEFQCTIQIYCKAFHTIAMCVCVSSSYNRLDLIVLSFMGLFVCSLIFVVVAVLIGSSVSFSFSFFFRRFLLNCIGRSSNSLACLTMFRFN